MTSFTLADPLLLYSIKKQGNENSNVECRDVIPPLF